MTFSYFFRNFYNKLKGVKYIIELENSDNLRSDGYKDGGIVQIPGEDSRF